MTATRSSGSRRPGCSRCAAWRRTPAALAVQAGLTAGAVLVGGIVGLLLVDGDVSLASTFASLAAISLLLVNVYTSLRLGAELRSPVWWLSAAGLRSEEHTSELQSRRDLVCRLLLEKKKKRKNKPNKKKHKNKNKKTI